MKIAFVISTVLTKSKGQGGHYYSLIETVTQLSKAHEVIIYNIGRIKSEALEKSSFKVVNIVDPGVKVFKLLSDFHKSIELEKPDRIHAFDSLAHFWARLVASKFKIQVGQTKCGGGNGIYYPHCDINVFYSVENYDYYSSKRKFKSSHNYIISNRTSAFDSDQEVISKLEYQIADKHNDALRFLRITRIGTYYKESSLSLIRLVNALNESGVMAIAVFVGTLEDDSVLEELKKEGNDNVYFFTAFEFTNNAKKIIEFADVVLGTGRGLMEASYKKKILLTPSNNLNFPVLVDETTFDQAYRMNFSERFEVAGVTENANFQKIVGVLTDSNRSTELQNFAYDVFKKYFDSASLIEKYDDVFREKKSKSSSRLLDLFLHYLFLLMRYYRQ